MKGALGCLAGLVLLVAGLLLAAVVGMGHALWRLRRNLRRDARQTERRPHRDEASRDAAAPRRKIYAPGEGEYVDFEEVDTPRTDND